jgi:hypothetical protein
MSLNQQHYHLPSRGGACIVEVLWLRLMVAATVCSEGKGDEYAYVLITNLLVFLCGICDVIIF